MNDPLVEIRSAFRLQAKDKMWVKGATALQHSRAEAEQRALASDVRHVRLSSDVRQVRLSAHTKKKAKKKAKPSAQGQLFLGRMKESQDGLTPRMRATGATQDFGEAARQRRGEARRRRGGGGEGGGGGPGAAVQEMDQRMARPAERAGQRMMLQSTRETVAFEPEPEINGGGEAEDAEMSADEDADDEEPNRMNQRRGSAPDMSNLMNVTVTRDVDDEPGPHAEDEEEDEEQEQEDDEEDDEDDDEDDDEVEDDGRVPISYELHNRTPRPLEEEEDAPLGFDRARRIEIRGTGFTDDDDDGDDDDLLSMPRKARRAAFRKAALADRPTAGDGGRLASAALFGRSAEISDLSDSTDQLDEMHANTRGSDEQIDRYDPRVTDSYRLDTSDLSESFDEDDGLLMKMMERKSKAPGAGFAPKGLAACCCFCALLLMVWLVLHFGFGQL